jgi:3-hydroxybutyryl-CoA dehydrogenase
MSQIKSVGLIGAGVMGEGTAQALTHFGYNVILVDISEKILNTAKSNIKNNIRFQALFNKDKSNLSPDELLERIRFTTDYDKLSNADFIIENVTEKWEIKKEVHLTLDKVIKANVIIAVNTSAIPITEIASITNRGEFIIGMHFMNPVHLKSTVEVIKGFSTSEETIERAKEFLGSIGKECVVVNDSPGFVSNRILMLMINEAIFLVQEKVATVEEIDKIFKTCFGHKMGPLETADLIGLDTVLFSTEVLYDNFNDSKYRPCPLLKKMVAAGFHGKKSGKGFYNYQTSVQNKI